MGVGVVQGRTEWYVCMYACRYCILYVRDRHGIDGMGLGMGMYIAARREDVRA